MDMCIFLAPNISRSKTKSNIIFIIDVKNVQKKLKTLKNVKDVIKIKKTVKNVG